MLTATNTSSVPVQAGIRELLSLENARSVARRELVRVARGVPTQANGQDHPSDALEDHAFSEEAGNRLASNVDAVLLRQKADGVSENFGTIVKNAIIASVVGGSGMFFVASLVYAALLSRLE